MGPNAMAITARLVGALLLTAGLYAASPALAADPSQWVGKYPSDRIDGKTFWETLGPALDAAVGTRLGTTVRRGWGPEIPVVASGGWVIAYACKAHDCGDNSVTVAVSPQRRVIACTFVNDEKDRGTWREAGRPPKTRSTACPEGNDMLPAMRQDGLVE
jgi:hypothetical protein